MAKSRSGSAPRGACVKPLLNVVRGFSLVHDPQGSDHKVESEWQERYGGIRKGETTVPGPGRRNLTLVPRPGRERIKVRVKWVA